MVCGGAGFIGSHLVERLLADGDSVDVVDDLSSGSIANLAESRSAGGDFRFHHLDVGAIEFPELVGLREPEIIVHLGVLPPSARDMGRTVAAFSSMVSVLEAARVNGVRKVVSCLPAGAIYGEVEAKFQPVKEGRYGAALGVGSVVARSLVDLFAVYREQHAIEFTVLAATNVYGPRQRPEDGVVAAFAAAVAGRIDGELHGTGRQTRDFLFIDDMVDALARAKTRGGGLTINVGTGEQTSIEELWRLVAARSTQKVVRTERRRGDLQRLAVSPVRARIQLGWSAWTPLRSGIESVLEPGRR